jgi:hypothetical protein
MGTCAILPYAEETGGGGSDVRAGLAGSSCTPGAGVSILALTDWQCQWHGRTCHCPTVRIHEHTHTHHPVIS